ncbi:MAG: fructosamine kinase family protein [Chitinophagaceae bacterium]|nr:fructosamine kinase family protein [Chitinophagaceae bacterium]
MTTQLLKELLKEHIFQQLDMGSGSIEITPVGGGSINDCYKATVNNQQKYFLKLNSAAAFPELFEKERNGLAFLTAQDCLGIPSVICCENTGDKQLLLLDWIESGARNDRFWETFGEQLAHLHYVSSDHFGFTEDNYMGSLPQINTPVKNWSDFFIHYRLAPQIELARSRRLLDNNQIMAFESLFTKLPSLFNIEKPSLLHGDLWSGNFMCDEKSQPVLIDPAVYFGHRSMDLGMTTLFGGFDKTFYDAYHYHFPFPDNYREQWELCNLYPLLIHLNLFGTGYLHDITATLRKFI